MTDLSPWLSAQARAAMERARERPFSYGVRVLAAPSEPPRLVVALGEMHVKLGRASEIGKQLIDAFELRGVETFQRKRVLAGRILKVLIEAPRALIRILSLGLVKDSTIVDSYRAGGGKTFPLESTSRIPVALHIGAAYLAAFFALTFTIIALLPVPGRTAGRLLDVLVPVALVLDCHLVALIVATKLQRKSWSWLIHPVLAIVTVRDEMMADGTVYMLREHPQSTAALVIMGRAHLAGYERTLVEKYGFTRVG